MDRVDIDDLAEVLRAAANGDFSRRPKGVDAASLAAAALLDKLVEVNLSRLDRAVMISMRGNDASVDAAWCLRSMKEFSAAAQETAVSCEELSASIGQIDDAADEVAHRLSAAHSAASSGRETANESAKLMRELVDNVEGASERVEALVAAAGNIESFVVTIDRIAQQTNLLAINASIEAARAGAAGAGFRIVADEVRNLSAQTTDATDDIRGRIIALRAEAEEVSSAIASYADAAQISSKNMASIDETMVGLDHKVAEAEERMAVTRGALKEQRDAAMYIAGAVARIDAAGAEMLNRVHLMASKADQTVAIVSEEITDLAELEIEGKTLRLAKSDHVIWKKKLADMFANKLDLAADELASHHSCRLGKWYYNDAAQQFKGDPHFTALEAPHAAVHEAGKAAAKAYVAGDLEKALGAYADMDVASREVLRLLDALLLKTSGEARPAVRAA